MLCAEVFVFLDVERALFIAAIIHFGDADVITFAFDRMQFMYVVGSNKRAVMQQRERVPASTLVFGYNYDKANGIISMPITPICSLGGLYSHD